MTPKKILGLNTEFESLEYDCFREIQFCSTISLFDFDAVVIDVGFFVSKSYGTSSEMYQNKMLLSRDYSHQIVEDFERIKEQIVELLKQGKCIFLLMGKNEKCLIYTGKKQIDGNGKNARQVEHVKELDTYSFLPIKIKATHVYGDAITPCCNAPYQEFLRKTLEYCEYASYFSIEENHTVLAQINGTAKAVAAVIPYEKGKIVCLPRPFYEYDYINEEDWPRCGKAYLDALFELNDRLSASENEVSFPKWVEDICILDEHKELAKKEEIQKRLAELQAELEQQERAIEKIQRYKLLITSSGERLEMIVKQVLNELGFSLVEAEKGRSDIIAQYENCHVVAEIKGVTKSAAEKHAAQLEKWVSQYIEEKDKHPKALLIVNGFSETPVKERKEEVFPHQMLKYCESRGHALITTTQLLCLFIEIQQCPECKHERIIELLSCVGKYQRYQNVDKYLISYESDE